MGCSCIHGCGVQILRAFIALSSTRTLFTRTGHGINLYSALEAYKKKTGKNLTFDPLLRRFETCHSPDDILVILREHISGLDDPQSSSDGLAKCLNLAVNVLHTLQNGMDGRCVGHEHQRPLYFVSLYRSINIMWILLEHGAVTDVWSKVHTTPLHLASSAERLKAVRLLL